MARLRAGLVNLIALCALCAAAIAAPVTQPPLTSLSSNEIRKRCSALPPDDAAWFYLGAPDAAHARPALLALSAILAAFGDQLPRDPACIKVEVLGERGLKGRFGKMDRHAPPAGVVGFHTARLGTDSTVFVTPQPHLALEIVITHEVLHALSHRFSGEAQRRHLGHMVEGATDWVTRELADASLGVPRSAYHTGYDGYVAFFSALVKQLGTDGAAILIDAYFRNGYYDLEKEVDQKLGISLREAARALEVDDLRAAMEGLGLRPGSHSR